jgi:hypothetical protein
VKLYFPDESAMAAILVAPVKVTVVPAPLEVGEIVPEIV